MKTKQIALLGLGLQASMLGLINIATAQEPSPQKKSDSDNQPVLTIPVVGAYLGIGLEPLHPAFGGHLPESLIEGQGVLVASVVKDSPADKAGIKLHDILTGFDDQKLFSADQLVRLVRAAKAGQVVKLQFVRAGKLESVTVSLGDEPPHIADKDRHHRDLWERRLPRMPLSPWRSDVQIPRLKNKEHWERFESLKLKKLEGDRFRAELSYLDKDGKTQNHTFEGTREEIRKQIEAEKDLPADERDQLLNGLDLQPLSMFPSFLDELFGKKFEWPDPFRDF